MNKLKALLIILCAACVGAFAYAASLLPASPQTAEAGSSSSSVREVSSEEQTVSSRKQDVSSKETEKPAQKESSAAAASSRTASGAVSSAPSSEPGNISSSESSLPAEAPASAAVKEPVKAAVSPSVSISTQQINPGETLAIIVAGAKSPATMKIDNDFGFVPRFSPLDEERFIAFLPLSYFTLPGAYRISISGDDFSEPVSFDIEVTDKAFEVQQLTVDEGTAGDTIFSDEASKEYRAKIWPLKELYDDTRYFDGRFLLPVQGPITTQFGMIRYVNGQPNPRHDGVDLSAAAGVPVQCAQNGKVLFADFVKLTGNTVVVEHGYGLKSWYFHMESLDVEAGDQVKTGDILGKVGSTGFSTGPHLHFSASINGVYINPFTLVETDLLETLLADAGE
jgi:murein DD-endopeptidase MepM/ murein hydrolase activator NlpD